MKSTKKNPANRGKKVTERSRVVAGLKLIPSIDGRSHYARIMRATRDRLIEHCGGEERISETKRLMVERASACQAELKNLERKFALARADGGEPVIADLELYGRLTGQQRRCCEPLGWERTLRDVTPDLDTYLRTKYSDVEDAEVDA